LQVFDICHLRVVTSVPKFKKADDTANHRLLALSRVWKIDFHMIFENVRINPSEYLPLGIKENHVLIYHEETVERCKAATSANDHASIHMTSFAYRKFL